MFEDITIAHEGVTGLQLESSVLGVLAVYAHEHGVAGMPSIPVKGA